MAWSEKEWRAILQGMKGKTALYLSAADEYERKRRTAQAAAFFQKDEQAEHIVVQGSAMIIEQLVQAAGALSLFGTRRLIELVQLDPAAMSEADCKILCELIKDSENAIFMISTLHTDIKKSKSAKKVQQLIQTVKDNGFYVECAVPQSADARRLAEKTAKKMQTVFADGALEQLQERCGTDLFLIEQETAKLAAACGYTQITPQLVEHLTAASIEADVFVLVRLVQQKNKRRAMQQLMRLLWLRHDPIAIAAAFIGVYTDLYRMKCAQQTRRSVSQAVQDFDCRRNEWRLQKAAQAAGGYSQARLQEILTMLAELDEKLKASPIPAELLLQTVLMRMMQTGGCA